MKNFLMTIIVPVGLMACPSPYANVNVCELMPPAAKEAEMIWKNTKNSEAAIKKLEEAGMARVMMFARKNKPIRNCKELDIMPILIQYRTYLLDVIPKHGVNSDYEYELERVNQAINKFPLSK